MPIYKDIAKSPDGKRTVDGLLRLRNQLALELPPRNLSDTLLLATWNVRELGSGKYGKRSDECLHYIAEIVSRFDLVAVQEVREDLRAFRQILGLLGGWWKYIVTDVTAGTAGNKERMAFLYDGRKVRFNGLAGEIVLPPSKKDARRQLARTPFVCGFQAGWAKFELCTVHIYYGKGVAADPDRVREIQELAAFMAERSDKGEHENLILLGDFNIFARKDVTMQAILDAKFVVPPELQTVPGSNVAQDKHYDQIAFKVRDLQLAGTGKAGVLDYYRSVYRLADEAAYAAEMGPAYSKPDGGAKFYNEWRTYRMSDHLPMWVELRVDFGEDYLRQRLQ